MLEESSRDDAWIEGWAPAYAYRWCCVSMYLIVMVI